MTFKDEEVGEILGILHRDKYCWGATTNSQRTEKENWESLKEWDAFLPGKKKKKELNKLARCGLGKPWSHSTAKSRNYNLHLLWNCLLVSLCWENLSEPWPQATNLMKSSNILQCSPLLLIHTSLVRHHFNFTEMSAVVQRTSTICRRLTDLERWDSFHPRTRKLTPSSALFPTHSPVSFRNYQRTFNEPTRSWKILFGNKGR